MKKCVIIFGLLFSVPIFAQEIQNMDLTDQLVVLSEQPIVHVPGPEKILLPTVSYTWADFLQGKSCQDDFDQLQQLPFLSPEQRSLKDKMQIYCVKEIKIWKTLLSLFRQNKKTLLIDNTLKKNGSFMGYVKAIPYYLLDIHHTRPVNADISSKLDKIQNAIEAKNPEQVVLLMQDLSPKEQLFFISLFNEATALIDFEQALSKKEESDQ